MELKDKITFARKKKNLTQDELAALLNVDNRTVVSWEEGISTPNTNHLEQLSNMLEVNIDFLVGEQKIQKTESAHPVREEEELQSPSATTEKRLSKSRIKTIKVWLIIGCVLNPMCIGGSARGLGAFSLLFLLLYLVTIPLCCRGIQAIKNARSKADLLPWGVLSILFLSGVGGIIMLCTKDSHFETVEIKAEEPAKDRTKTHQNDVFVETKKKEIPSADSDNSYWTKQAILFVDDAIARVLESDFSEEKKNVTNDRLEGIKNKASNSKTFGDYRQIVSDVRLEIKELDAKRNKKIILGFSLFAAIYMAIVIAISIPIILNNKKKRAEMYDDLVYMVYHYDSDNYYKIKSYISMLYSYYDLTDIREEFRNASNYDDLLSLISSYDGTKTSDSSIESKLKNIDSSYKKKTKIENDFSMAKTYIANTTITNYTNLAKNITSSSSSAVRQNLKFLYAKANTSGLWDYDNYIKRIPVPYLLYGIKYTYNSYSFYWNDSDSGSNQTLTRNIPMLSSYDSSKSYYFDHSYDTSDNNIMFYIYLQSNSSSKVNLFKVNYLYYHEASGTLRANTYTYGDGETNDFNCYL